MNQDAFAAFARWIAYGLAHNKELDIHLDDDNNDIVLHLFLPNHTKVTMASKAFQGLDQVSDFLRSSRLEKDSSMQKNVDVDLGKSILKEIGIVGWTNTKLRMPVKSPPDMDLYIPEQKQKGINEGVWLEFSTGKNNLKEHLLKKLGQIYLAKLLKMEEVEEKIYDEKKGEEAKRIRSIKISKFMHISLYPLEEEDMSMENEKISFFSFFDSSFQKSAKRNKIVLDVDKINDFLLKDGLENRIREKWKELIDKIEKFIYA